MAMVKPKKIIMIALLSIAVTNFAVFAVHAMLFSTAEYATPNPDKGRIHALPLRGGRYVTEDEQRIFYWLKLLAIGSIPVVLVYDVIVDPFERYRKKK